MSVKNLPDYHFKPLALTVDQIENPTTVILDFFTNFHLPDFREHFKKMFEASLNQETTEPHKHHHTFTEIEKVIEACWVIRENLKEKNGQGIGIVFPVPGRILGKEALLIEKVKTEPLQVIRSLFETFGLNYFQEMIRDWHFVASTSDCVLYEDLEHRRQLFVLSRELNLFTETVAKLIDPKYAEDHTQFQVLNSFFEKFPIVYLRRELKDWLDAGLAFDGKWPVDFRERDIVDCYDAFLCLFEAAKILTLTVR